MTDESKAFTYDVFISYSRKNEIFASALQQALQNYKPEKDLKVPQRFIKAFRDKKDFTGSNYYKSLSKHLGVSSKLIVICSPDARQSKYVNDEIKQFVGIRGSDHIIPVLFAGIPNNEVKAGHEHEMAFPDELCKAIEMPLAVNYLGFNAQKDTINKGGFTDSWYSILADTYELSRSEMEQREKRRRMRRRKITISALSGSLLVLTVSLMFALVSRNQAVTARNDALTAKKTAEAAQKSEKEQRVEADKQRDDAIQARNETTKALNSEMEAKIVAETRRKEAETATRNERVAKNQAQEQTIIAVAKAEESKRRLVTLYEEQGRQASLQGDSQRSMVYLNQAYQERQSLNSLEDDSSLRFLLAWNRWSFAGQIASLHGHNSRLVSVEFSRDGKRILTASKDKKAKLWDAETGNLIATVGAGVISLESAFLSPDGTRILTTGLGYREGDGQNYGTWELEGYLWDPNQKESINTNAYSITKSTKRKEIPKVSPRFSEDGKTFELDINEEGEDYPDQQKVMQFNLSNGEQIEARETYKETVKLPSATSVMEELCNVEEKEIFSFDQNKNYFIRKVSDLAVDVWDSKNCLPLKTLTGHTEPINIAVFSPTSDLIVTAGEDNRAIVWDWRNVNQPIISSLQDNPGFTFFNGAQTVVVNTSNGLVSDWNTETNQIQALCNIKSLKTERSEIYSVGNHMLIEVEAENTELWSISDCRKKIVFEKNKWIMGFSPNGKYLLTRTPDEGGNPIEIATLEVWNAETGHLIGQFQAPDEFQDFSLSYDGKRIFGSLNGRNHGNFVSTTIDTDFYRPYWLGNEDDVIYSRFSQDGNKLITATTGVEVKLWDLQSEERHYRLLIGYKSEITGGVFNPKGTRALIESKDGTVKLWNVLDGSLLFTSKGSATSDTNAFSRDGNFVITVGIDGAAKIWDLKSGQLLTSLSIPAAKINSAFFSLTDDKFLTTSNDGVTRIWSAQKDERSSNQVKDWVEKVVPLELTDGRIALKAN